MNINHLLGRPVSSSTVRGNGPDRVNADETPRASESSAAEAKDRVELSASGREANAGNTPVLAFARKALENIPPLSQERVAEILERIKDDYYERPEVTRQIAQRVAATFREENFDI